MATNLEFLASQRKLLFNLLKVKRANPNTKVNELEELILETVATMQKDDVKYVEEQIAKL
jgi:hypothetical protein